MIKLIESSYDSNSGMSYVSLDTDLGEFCGYAFLSDEDKEYESQFFGCELAEVRALIDYYLEKRKKLNIELETLYKLKTDFKKNTNFGFIHLDSPENKMLEKRIRQKEEQKNKYTEELRLLREFDIYRAEERILIINDTQKKIEEIQRKRQENN